MNYNTLEGQIKQTLGEPIKEALIEIREM